MILIKSCEFILVIQILEIRKKELSKYGINFYI